MLHQMDNFSISDPNQETADKVFHIISQKLQLLLEDEPPFKKFVLLQDFHRVDINQTKEYIEIPCPDYIN